MAPILPLIASNAKFFNPERIHAYLEASKQGLNLNDLPDYFESKLSMAQTENVEENLLKAERKLDPNKF